MHLRELKQKPMNELVAMAGELNIEGATGMRKRELTFAILKAQPPTEPLHAEGVLELMADGFGFLRAAEDSYLAGADDIYVSPSQVRRLHLRTGDTIVGALRHPREREAFFALLKIETVNGAPIEPGAAGKIHFDNLTPTYPSEQLTLESESKEITTRVIDMLCPIGKGQRCLVVSPPRAGKTTLLRQLATAIAVNHPSVHTLVALIDERPEEVTSVRRSVKAEVVSSAFDEPPARHIEVAEMVIEKAKRLVEYKQDVVVIIDSLTKLARAYSATAPTSGKPAQGRIDPGALQKIKRLFSAARNVEEGGSLTIIATAQVGTGQRMDDVIAEELRAAANSEIILDHELQKKRIFPAIDVNQSGTQKAELLLPPLVHERVGLLRQLLSPLSAADAMDLLLDKVGRASTNVEFLETMNQ